MAEKECICFEKKELAIVEEIFAERNKVSYSQIFVNASQIRKIFFDRHEIQKFFKVVESEKIVIALRTRVEPIVILKHRHPELFDSYKQNLIKFAEANKIPVENLLA